MPSLFPATDIWFIAMWLAFLLLILLLVLVAGWLCITGARLVARQRFLQGGVYLLLGAMLLYAELGKRSKAGFMARWLAGEDGAHQNVNDLAEDTKKAVDSSELQRWAVTVLQEAQHLKPGSPEAARLLNDKLLPSIRDLRTNGLPLEDWTIDSEDSDSPQEGSVCITWGGGFGHWGIRVGSPTFKAILDSNDTAYLEWKPGIYFWYETQ